jgi:hypothetical protein
MSSAIASLLPFFRRDVLEVEASTPAALTLRRGRALIVFDRLSRVVTRNGKLLSAFGSIQHVRVTREQSDNDQPVWSLSLGLTGSRAIPIGRMSDANSAATVAGKIGSITGARLVG